MFTMLFIEAFKTLRSLVTKTNAVAVIEEPSDDRKESALDSVGLENVGEPASDVVPTCLTSSVPAGASPVLNNRTFRSSTLPYPSNPKVKGESRGPTIIGKDASDDENGSKPSPICRDRLPGLYFSEEYKKKLIDFYAREYEPTRAATLDALRKAWEPKMIGEDASDDENGSKPSPVLRNRRPQSYFSEEHEKMLLDYYNLKLALALAGTPDALQKPPGAVRDASEPKMVAKDASDHENGSESGPVVRNDRSKPGCRLDNDEEAPIYLGFYPLPRLAPLSISPWRPCPRKLAVIARRQELFAKAAADVENRSKPSPVLRNHRPGSGIVMEKGKKVVDDSFPRVASTRVGTLDALRKPPGAVSKSLKPKIVVEDASDDENGSDSAPATHNSPPRPGVLMEEVEENVVDCPVPQDVPVPNDSQRPVTESPVPSTPPCVPILQDDYEEKDERPVHTVPTKDDLLHSLGSLFVHEPESGRHLRRSCRIAQRRAGQRFLGPCSMLG